HQHVVVEVARTLLGARHREQIASHVLAHARHVADEFVMRVLVIIDELLPRHARPGFQKIESLEHLLLPLSAFSARYPSSAPRQRAMALRFYPRSAGELATSSARLESGEPSAPSL